MVKVKFSDTYDAKKKRVARLPVLGEKYIKAFSKRDAYGVVDAFQEGIRKNNFKLQPLKDSTLRAKRRKGFPKPKVPLYGMGDLEDRSYINMMQVYTEKKSYAVRPSRKKHHEADLTLRKLYLIHEFGTVIQQGNRTIVIPPRPAFMKAYKRYMKKRRGQETSPDVKELMTEYINSGRQTRGRKLEREVRKLRKHDAKNS